MSSSIRRFSLSLALGAALLAGGAAVTPLQAQGGALKVAVIDTEQILMTSQAGKKVVADLKKLQETKEGELRTRQQEIKDLQTKLSEGRLSLAQDKLSDMEKQLEDRVIALRRLQDDANRDLTKKREELLGQIDQRVMPVINQIGKEQGFTLIFRKFESGLIYADEAIDITKVVVQRLDAAPAQGK
jgi:outer membrane protein